MSNDKIKATKKEKSVLKELGRAVLTLASVAFTIYKLKKGGGK